LHITGISTAKSIELIAQAKKEGLSISCSVTAYQLHFCDEDLVNYDTNLKLNPPLRTREDMMALQNAVREGLVDCIASHHLPQNWDNKVCEFEYAKSGMIGLQTSFAAVNTILPELSSEQLVQLFSGNARNIFAIPTTNINVGSKAELTLFCRSGNTSLTTQNNKSKSANSAFLNGELNGKVLGILHKGQIFTN